MENIENEIWKDIDGHEGIYQVSNLGRVKTLSKMINCWDTPKRRKEMILKPYTTGNKVYLRVSLTKNGVSKNCAVHRLVANAFIPNHQNKPCINHINGVKDDNRVENIEWCTYKENTAHAIKMNLIQYDYENNANAKLTNEDVLKIRKMLDDGVTGVVLAKIFCVTQTTISYIKNNKWWVGLE